MESGSSFVNNKATKGIIYAKSGTFVDLNNANNFVVYFEIGADVYNQGKSVLVEKECVVFDYTDVPEVDCRDLNQTVKLDNISFLLFLRRFLMVVNKFFQLKVFLQLYTYFQV
jgi:hypothetical protein